jgi:hypothetical protein
LLIKVLIFIGFLIASWCLLGLLSWNWGGFEVILGIIYGRVSQEIYQGPKVSQKTLNSSKKH